MTNEIDLYNIKNKKRHHCHLCNKRIMSKKYHCGTCYKKYCSKLCMFRDLFLHLHIISCEYKYKIH